MLLKRIVIMAILGVIGAALMIGGVYVMNNPAIPKEYAGEATGVITQLDTHTSTDSRGNKKESHQVTVSFNVDGTEYGGLLNEYNSSMKKGADIELIYDIRDPSVFETPGKTMFIAYILMGIGAAFVLCGIASLFGKLRVTTRRRLI